jgi:hypothetical protein
VPADSHLDHVLIFTQRLSSSLLLVKPAACLWFNCSLMCDEDNQYDLSEGRAKDWIMQLKTEGFM